MIFEVSRSINSRFSFIFSLLKADTGITPDNEKINDSSDGKNNSDDADNVKKEERIPSLPPGYASSEDPSSESEYVSSDEEEVLGPDTKRVKVEAIDNETKKNATSTGGAELKVVENNIKEQNNDHNDSDPPVNKVAASSSSSNLDDVNMGDNHNDQQQNCDNHNQNENQGDNLLQNQNSNVEDIAEPNQNGGNDNQKNVDETNLILPEEQNENSNVDRAKADENAKSNLLFEGQHQASNAEMAEADEKRDNDNQKNDDTNFNLLPEGQHEKSNVVAARADEDGGEVVFSNFKSEDQQQRKRRKLFGMPGGGNGPTSGKGSGKLGPVIGGKGKLGPIAGSTKGGAVRNQNIPAASSSSSRVPPNNNIVREQRPAASSSSSRVPVNANNTREQYSVAALPSSSSSRAVPNNMRDRDHRQHQPAASSSSRPQRNNQLNSALSLATPRPIITNVNRGDEYQMSKDESLLYQHVHAKLAIEFHDLLMKMFKLDKYKRITPSEAMNHDFFKSVERLFPYYLPESQHPDAVKFEHI